LTDLSHELHPTIEVQVQIKKFESTIGWKLLDNSNYFIKS